MDEKPLWYDLRRKDETVCERDREVDFDYKEYEEKCDRIREENERLIEIFERDLSGFSDRTVKRHISNVDFYINVFLLREDAVPFQEGVWRINEFLGDFFIRKCAWSTPQTIRSTAASIKKFYKSMAEHGKIRKEDYHSVCEEIKESIEEWQNLCAIYNNPKAVNPFNFFSFF